MTYYTTDDTLPWTVAVLTEQLDDAEDAAAEWGADNDETRAESPEARRQ
jgi:Neuraminidase (sialidase)